MQFLREEITMSQYLENRNEENKKKKSKFDFKTKKENTLRSLREVEYFLTDFKRISKHIKLYQLLK